MRDVIAAGLLMARLGEACCCSCVSDAELGFRACSAIVTLTVNCLIFLLTERACTDWESNLLIRPAGSSQPMPFAPDPR